MRVAQQVKRLLAGLVEVVAVWERQPAAGLGIDIVRQRLGLHSGLSSRGFAVSYPNVLGGPLHALGRSRSIVIPIGWASRSKLHVRRPPGATVDLLSGWT